MRESLKRAGAASARALLKGDAVRRRVVGLCYHSIHPSLSFASASPELFERQLDLARRDVRSNPAACDARGSG